ncbi:MAG: hypothetical protein AAF962_21630 [Actinomycetota bacterium]
MTSPVLTTVAERWRTRVGSGGRCLAWSPQCRLLVVGADGRALVDQPGQLTPPLAPDPVAATWMGERQLLVVDTVLGAVFAGSGAVGEQAIPGARCAGHAQSLTVVAGVEVMAVFGRRPDRMTADLVPTGVGCGHALAHVGGHDWVVGGTTGVALVDVMRGRVEASVEAEGVRTLAWAGAAERLVFADLGGSLHVLDRFDLDARVELQALPEPVRHLALAADGDLLVVAAEGSFAWWWLDGSGLPLDEPDWAADHGAAVTALAMSSDRLVASGDAAGTVRLWSPRLTDHPVAELSLDTEIVDAAWSRCGRHLAVAAMSGEVAVVEVTPGQLV